MKGWVDLGATKEDEYERNCAVIKQKHLERKYNEDDLNKQMEKVDLIEWKVLLQDNEKSNCKKNHTTSINIQQNASKHIKSRKIKLAHSADQSWIP